MAENKQKWVGEYLQAVLEIQARVMPNRIESARTAISERLKELEGDSNHHAERSRIRYALNSLTALEEDVRRWNKQAA
jgi:hypothetical protein